MVLFHLLALGSVRMSISHLLLWMHEILHHFETMGKSLFVGIYEGIIIP